ncbi:MAG: transposase [Lentisphaeria bacterium]|nr:transposase [Lentisphaeria bacterium]
MGNVAQKSEKSIAGAIKINENEIVDHLSQLVRQSVAETINRLLDAAMLKAIHAQEDKKAAREKAKSVMEKLREKKLDGIAKFIEESLEETLSYMDFPSEHWRKIRTNNGLERIMKEIRRRTRVVGSFPDGYSAMMLVGARLRHISTTKWGTRQYLACKM